MKDTVELTNGHTHHPTPPEDEVLAQLAEIRKLLEMVARLSCPVCRPVALAETHPETVKAD